MSLPLLYSPDCPEVVVVSETQAVGRARTSPCDSQTYDALWVRFSATVGEGPEVELGLDYTDLGRNAVSALDVVEEVAV